MSHTTTDPAPAAAPPLRSWIDLPPHVWAAVPWRPVADVTIGAAAGRPPPFDPDAAAAALGRDGGRCCCEWSTVPFAPPLDSSAAAAWLWATHQSTRTYARIPTAQAQERLAHPGPPPDVARLSPFHLAATSMLPDGAALACLAALVAPSAVVDWLLGPDRFLISRRAALVQGVRPFLLPRLTAAERDAFADAVRDRIRRTPFPARLDHLPDIAHHLAGPLGLVDEVAAVVNSWPDDRYREFEVDGVQRPQWLVLGLGSADAVVAALRRLRLRLRTPSQVAAFLARTGTSALDLVLRAVTSADRESAARLAAALGRVHDVAAVAPMLELLRSPRPPAAARAWLTQHPREVAIGAAQLLARSGPARDQALDLLRARRRAGDDLAAALPHLAAADADRLRTTILDEVDPGGVVLSVDALPAPLAAALRAATSSPGGSNPTATTRVATNPAREPAAPDLAAPPTTEADPIGSTAPDAAVPSRTTARARNPRRPGWLDPAVLPPVVVGGTGRLADDAVTTVLLACRSLTTGTPAPPLLTAVRAHADADDFAWAVFTAWRTAGSPATGRWALLTLGALGGDRTAARLTPLVRAWPGQSQHQRAVLGLDVLAAIGTDTALMALTGIAQRLRYPGLRAKARQVVERVAADRGLTRAELEDRVVPDGGLDADGRYSFDFGPRRFTFVLGPGLVPMVRDEAGTVRATLPRPGVRDDPTRAAIALTQWRLLKQVVGEVAAIQAERLEQAMITGRRWVVADFHRYLLGHPLQRHLVRRLVWGAWRPDGALAATFRVTDELDLADAADDPIVLAPDWRIGVIHPLQLDGAATASWSEVLGDYAVVAPFPQLGRPRHDLDDHERTATVLTRFAGRLLAPATLVRLLEQRGWDRGVGVDGDVTELHAKPFPAHGVTAVAYYSGVSITYPYEDDDQAVERCVVLGRVIGATSDLGRDDRDDPDADGPRVPWGEVDPVVRCEVLADLHAVAEKAR